MDDCVLCVRDDLLDRLDYSQDKTYPVCGLCLNKLLDGKRRRRMKANCKHCGVETGGADCCFPCLLKTSQKARIIFGVE